jgi:hypothetical protein
MNASVRCSSTSCSSNQLILWRIHDSAGTLTLSNTAIPITKAKLPFYGTQQGGSVGNPNTYWDTGDLRVTNVFYDVSTNSVYTAHAVNHNIGGGYEEATTRWYEVQPGGTLDSSVLARSGYAGAPNLDTGWPAVATDSAGNLFLTMSGAGVDYPAYLSGFAAVVPPGSTTDVAPVLMDGAGGTARYEVFSGPERWGDFNSMGRDPADGTKVWAVNQLALSVGGPTTTNFQETVNQLTYSP